MERDIIISKLRGETCERMDEERGKKYKQTITKPYR